MSRYFLFDDQGRAAHQTAEPLAKSLELVLDAADPAWVELATATIRDIARRQQELTADSVWQALGERRPREPRALGPLMIAAQKAGVIRRTDRVIRSERRRGGLTQVWESLIFVQ